MSKVTVQTQIGSVEWFSLTKEDKFGNYTTSLTLEESPETQKLISKINELAGADGRKPMEIQADGSVKLKLKLKSRGQTKKGETYVVNPPAIYDRLGKVIQGEALAGLNLGNGSKIRAKIELSAYEFMGQKGVSLKPRAVQISEVVEFSGGGDSGFDALEFSDNDSALTEDDFGF